MPLAGARAALATRRAWAWALIGVSIAMMAACSRSYTPQPSGPLVLIVVDTLRADHVSCYGYERPTTPVMCAVAADGVRFEHAYTTRTSTTPAIASMLTGLYPHRHGIKHLYLLLPQAMTTLPERIQARGWATGAFVSSFVMVRDFSGLEQGFDVYDDDVRTRELARENYQRGASDTVARAATWLRAHGPNAFLFLHLIEPHGPYTPPTPYRERFALAPTGPEPDEVPEYQRLPGMRTVNEYIGSYDGEVAAADAALAELVAGLRERGWYAPATIIIVADHGESFGEEGLWFNHGTSVHDPQAHVPLIVKFPAGMAAPPPGSHVATPVSVLDIYPTLLHAAGIGGQGGAPDAVDLAGVAGGMPRPVPPVTELERAEGLTLAVHDQACTGRWFVPRPAADSPLPAGDPSAWLAIARPLDLDPAGSAVCARAAAVRAAPLIADRLTFRLDVPLVWRSDMRDYRNRARFIEERLAREAPLADHEREALRQLGYAK